MDVNYKPCVLIILDGFGIAPPSEYNVISRANLPYYTELISTYPTVLLDAAGLSVGLPFGEVGNSEVGHYNIGSGQLLYQSLPRINIGIDDGSFFNMPLLIKAANRVKNGKGALHLIGMIGTGGVHSHQRHCLALLDFCKKQELDPKRVFLHIFLDGRDTARDVGLGFLEKIIESSVGVARIATISGRFYAMDRNNKWDRTAKTYNAMVYGEADFKTEDPIQAVKDSYIREVYDEEFIPTVIIDEKDQPVSKIFAGDTLIFFNFRADRARQITEAFVEDVMKEFERGPMLDDISVITFTEYKKDMPVHILFPPQIVTNPLAKVISDHGFKQYHVAETEKYAHVTFFFNGLIEEPFPGEDRELVPSPPVITYDEKPEMSANGVTNKLIDAIRSDKYHFLLANYANGDMVGHTGNLEASMKAVETLDACLARVVPEILKKGGLCCITADHGNVEEVFNYQTYEIDKEHSIYPVPFIVVSNDHKGKVILQPKNGNDLSGYEPTGILADVAPTILDLLGLPKIPEMNGGLNFDHNKNKI